FRRESEYISPFRKLRNESARKRRGPVCRPPTGAKARSSPRELTFQASWCRKARGWTPKPIVADRLWAARGCCIELGLPGPPHWEDRMAKSNAELTVNGQFATATSFTGKKRIRHSFGRIPEAVQMPN